MKVQVSWGHRYYQCADIAHTKKPDFKYLFNAFGHNWTFSDIFELNKFLVTPFQYPAPLRWTLRRGEEAEEGKGRNFLNRPNCNDHTCPDDQLVSWKGSHKVFWGKVQYFAEEMMNSFIRNIRILKLGKMFETFQQTISIVLSSCKNRNYRN